MADSDYQQHLNKLHSGFNTPDEIINQVTEEATGLIPIEKRKIQAGEANEVYDLTLPNGKHVVARISRNEDSEFKKEEWAINKVKQVGVPVPTILLIKDIQLDNKASQICIQEKVDGDPLERGNISYQDLDQDLLKNYIVQAGEILSKIHTIEVERFGNLDEKRESRYTDLKNLILSETINDIDGFIEICQINKLDEKIIVEAFKAIKIKINKTSDVKPVLTHLDYVPKHFMVKKEKIVSIIDWGLVSGHSPIMDFAVWEFWYPEIPLEWLKEGYTNKNLFDNNFEYILHLLMLVQGLNNMWWYHETGYTKGVRNVFERIKEILKSYS